MSAGAADLVRFVPAPASWCTQFSVLTERSLKNAIRDPITSRARLAQAVFLSVVAGLIYWNLGMTQADVQNKNGALFFMLINQSMSGIFGVLQTFPLERPIFQREHENGSYSVSSYFMSKVISDLPGQVIPNTIFITVCWWMMNLRPDFDAFLIFLAIVLMSANAAMSLGMFVSCAVPNVTVALAVGPVVILPFMLFAGFFINLDSIGPGFKWLEYMSFFKYGFSGGATAVWEGTTLECPPLPAGADPSKAPPCFRTGEQVLGALSLNGSDDYFRDFIALACMAVGWRVVAFCALKWRTRGRQNE